MVLATVAALSVSGHASPYLPGARIPCLNKVSALAITLTAPQGSTARIRTVFSEGRGSLRVLPDGTPSEFAQKPSTVKVNVQVPVSPTASFTVPKTS